MNLSGVKHISADTRARYGLEADCREITLPLSNEILHLHAGNLARQVRAHVESSNAKICIWEYKEDSGATEFHEVAVNPTRSVKVDDWQLHVDRGFMRDAEQLRGEALPAETGGVLLGIVDQHDKTITLVKACAAPPNSTGTEMEFERAGYDPNDFMKDCSDRTAGIVTYVGEWHSHPPGVLPVPSDADSHQHAVVNEALLQEGRPALMMIVSDDLVGFYLEEGGIVTSIDDEDFLPFKKAS